MRDENNLGRSDFDPPLSDSAQICQMNEMDEIGRNLNALSINRFDVFEKWLIDAGAKVRIDITCVTTW